MSQPPQRAVVSVPPAEVSGSGAGESSTPAASANATQPVVRPALPAPAQVTVPGGAPMVQIAAVSHQEDADVLVAALRKRGYAVAVQHDAADGQYHVRIGPFSNLRDAGATRQKLLNDGYNAIVQP
jgi:cell division septation protein DedD